MQTQSSPVHVKHNEGDSRFEVEIDGSLAVSEYFRDGDRIVFTHTEVPDEFEGQGIGNALAKAALDYSRKQGLRVVPRCRFIASYIKRHPQYADLVDR